MQSLHIFNGNPKRGLNYLRRAVELDPFVPVYIVEKRLTAYYAIGDQEKVLSEARALHHQTRRSRYNAAASLVALGQTEAARDVIKTVIADDPSLSLDYVVRQELCCFRISCSSSLLDGCDEPEILLMLNPHICPKGADVRQATSEGNRPRGG